MNQQALYYLIRWLAESVHTLHYKNEWLYEISDLGLDAYEFLLLAGKQLVSWFA